MSRDINWRPIAEAGPEKQSMADVLGYVPSDGEDFERFVIVYWRGSGWLDHYKTYWKITQFARLERPSV